MSVDSIEQAAYKELAVLRKQIEQNNHDPKEAKWHNFGDREMVKLLQGVGCSEKRGHFVGAAIRFIETGRRQYAERLAFICEGIGEKDWARYIYELLGTPQSSVSRDVPNKSVAA